MATWAEFVRADPELAAFGAERLEGRVCFHATLLADGAPRVHPVEPWIASGLLLVRFRARSPKVDEVGRDGRYALHTLMDNPDGIGGEFLVRGWMERISPEHPGNAAVRRGLLRTRSRSSRSRWRTRWGRRMRARSATRDTGAGGLEAGQATRPGEPSGALNS